MGISALGLGIQDRPSGVTQAQHFGAFIKGLSGGIVQGLGQKLPVQPGIHPNQVGMAPRYGQGQHGKIVHLRSLHCG